MEVVAEFMPVLMGMKKDEALLFHEVCSAAYFHVPLFAPVLSLIKWDREVFSGISLKSIRRRGRYAPL